MRDGESRSEQGIEKVKVSEGFIKRKRAKDRESGSERRIKRAEVREGSREQK